MSEEFDFEEELEEEELLSQQLASKKVQQAIGKALAAVQNEKWDEAGEAIEAALDALEGYAYGYPKPSDLQKALAAAKAAIAKQNADAAKKALGQAMQATRKPERKKEAEDPIPPEPTEGRATLAGELRPAGNNSFTITLITPGEGNGFTWPAEVLKRDLAVFDMMTSFTNHERRDVMAARPGGRTIDDICGVIYNPRWDSRKEAVLATWRAMPPRGEWTGRMIDQIIKDREAGLPVPDVGVSVDVTFAHQDGKVTRLINAHSGDIVFNAARGPKYGEAFARVANAVQDQEGCDTMTTPAVDEKKVSTMLATMAETLVDQRLKASELPAPAQERVRAQFAGTTVLDVNQLDKAIEREEAYLASLVQDQVVQGLGAQPPAEGQPRVHRIGNAAFRIEVGHDPMDRVRLALLRWFGYPEPESGAYDDVPRINIGQFYADLTGDVNIQGVWNIEEARARTGLANLTDTTFNNVVADSLNKVVLDAWQVTAAAGYEWYKKVVHQQDFDSLYEVEWITYGGFGDLPELSAGQEYPELSISDLDTSEDTGNWVKPGGIISVPIETFDKGSKTGAFRALPRAMGVAAIRNLSAKVAAIFTDNSNVGPTLADSIALFNASHSNLGSSALSFTSWVATVQAMFKQTEQNSSKRMAIRPWGVLVPIDLEGEGIQVLTNQAEHDTSDRNINPYQYAAERVVVVPEWTDADNWAAFADPRVYPSIGVGYRFGRQPTVIAEPGGENSYGRFTQDVLRWKVMWFYVVSVINYRGLYKHNV